MAPLVLLAAGAAAPALAAAGTDEGGASPDAGAHAVPAPARLGPAIDFAVDHAPAHAPAAARCAAPACLRACSQRHPFCVEGAPKASTAGALHVLRAADRAWDALVDTLGAPAPDGEEGVWTLELRDAVDGGGDAVAIARDPIARFDRVSSFATVDARLAALARPGDGCGLDLAVARAIARGSVWRAAPATDEGSARAEADVLARLATPCAAGGEDVLEFQAHPEATLVSPVSPSFERGASSFFGWLDATFGARVGGLVTGLWSLSPTTTPAGATRWAGSPTGFDVLGKSLKDRLWPGSTLDDVFARFGAVRSTMEPPARVGWRIPWPEKARRLASPAPVSPTGASYVLVERGAAQADEKRAKLRVEAEWEDYGRLRWVVLKLDAAGRPTGEVPITSLDRGTNASMTIESLDGVDALLIACVDVGSTEHPFNPDQGEWEPHGWLLTLEGE
ncbi:MAG TPA: hypothetical protein VHV30_12470 [Polyangiaceae bacterium]|nr:hypothetical protein [Polyangiaceae bacterium]